MSLFASSQRPVRLLKQLPTDAFSNPHTLLRLARLSARFSRFSIAPEVIAQLQASVALGCINRLLPDTFWQELSAGLMHPYPSRMLQTLRDCHALKHLLPEIDALFGIPQSADDPPVVDVGRHQLRLLDAAAAVHAPLTVRFAGLMHKLGKAGSPREFLPSHYNHEARGIPLLEGICQRLPIPSDCRELAALVINEADRVHRAADMRAGAIASLLERIQAMQKPQRFENLLTVCSCDYRAYPFRPAKEYAKVVCLQRAYVAFVSIDTRHLDPGDVLPARAAAIAKTLSSESS